MKYIFKPKKQKNVTKWEYSTYQILYFKILTWCTVTNYVILCRETISGHGDILHSYKRRERKLFVFSEHILLNVFFFNNRLSSLVLCDSILIKMGRKTSLYLSCEMLMFTAPFFCRVIDASLCHFRE